MRRWVPAPHCEKQILQGASDLTGSLNDSGNEKLNLEYLKEIDVRKQIATSVGLLWTGHETLDPIK
jgi:hypothetical protein